MDTLSGADPGPAILLSAAEQVAREGLSTTHVNRTGLANWNGAEA